MKIKYIFTLLFILLFSACDSQSNKAQEVTNISHGIPEVLKKENFYTLTTTKDEKISFELSDNILTSKQLNGKMVLFNFWAPWCKPCLQEMPALVQIQERYKEDLIIIGVLFDKKLKREQLNNFITKYKLNFPVTIGEENFKLAKNLDDVQMIPESFLYSKEGLLVEKFVGEVDRTKLENYIKDNQ